MASKIRSRCWRTLLFQCSNKVRQQRLYGSGGPALWQAWACLRDKLYCTLAHEPQAVALDHWHDYLLLGAVAIGQGEHHIGRLRLGRVVASAYAHALDALVAFQLVVGVLAQQLNHLPAVAFGHGVGFQFAIVEVGVPPRYQAVVVEFGRSCGQFALVGLFWLVGTRAQQGA